MSEQTPAERADRIHSAFLAGWFSREAAIREIRKALNVTDVGAGELLDHPEKPSVRYAAIEGGAPC